ncbi:ribosomal protein L16 [Tuber magnatum]|uniref:Ribosomal protein L16 n=1 Tax=Tuber magnatum TaxID=42249 RepID=A0A317SWL7_9PEZI|nr:ribosomal protein L16 [Tuber magnatum]
MQSLLPSIASRFRTEVRSIPLPRLFSTTSTARDWLRPRTDPKLRFKGSPRVHTGGSTRGTKIAWGDYGMRLSDYHQRLSATHLKNAETAIKTKLRGMKYKLYKRVACNIAVFQKGNEVRMGTGKGTHKFWATRVPVSCLVFELKGEVHEQIVKEAFRLAGNKMPGKYEFVKKGDPPMIGKTPVTPEFLKELEDRNVKLPPKKRAWVDTLPEHKRKLLKPLKP